MLSYWVSLQVSGSSPHTNHVALLLLGPASSFLTGALVGVMLGNLTSRRSVALGACLLVMVVSIASGVWLYYWSPAFFVYDPFVGYISAATVTGDAIYDYELYLRHRTIVLAALALACVVLRCTRNDGETRPIARSVLGCILMVLLLVLREPPNSSSLPIFVSHDDVVGWLGATSVSDATEVDYDSRRIPHAMAIRWQGELDFAVHRIGSLLSLATPGTIIVYLFAEEQDKQRVLGSGRAEYAKPWTNELFLSLDWMNVETAHHEVAHLLVAHRFGRGWQHYLGTNPLVDEGLAVALSTSDAADVGLHEQAKVIFELGAPARLSDLTGLGFWRDPDVSYVLSGSFMAWLVEMNGLEVAGELYRTNGDFETVLGRSLEALENNWSSWVEQNARVGLRGRRATQYELSHLGTWAPECARDNEEAANRAWGQGRFARAAQLHGKDCMACQATDKLPCVDEARAYAYAGDIAAARATLAAIDLRALPIDYRLAYQDARIMVLAGSAERCSDEALQAAAEAVLEASSDAWQTWFLLRHLACVLSPEQRAHVEEHLRVSQLSRDNPLRRLEHTLVFGLLDGVVPMVTPRSEDWVLHLLAGLDLYGRGAYSAASHHLGVAAMLPGDGAGRFTGLLRYKILDRLMRAQSHGGHPRDAVRTLEQLSNLGIPDELIGVVDVTTWQQRLDFSSAREPQ